MKGQQIPPVLFKPAGGGSSSEDTETLSSMGGGCPRTPPPPPHPQPMSSCSCPQQASPSRWCSTSLRLSLTRCSRGSPAGAQRRGCLTPLLVRYKHTRLHTDKLLCLLVKAGCFWRKKPAAATPRVPGPPWFLAAFPLPAAKWEIAQLCNQAPGQRTHAEPETQPLLRRVLPSAPT